MKQQTETTMTMKDRVRLRDIWLDHFHNDNDFLELPVEVKWFTAVSQLQDERGDEVFSGELRDREHRLIELGLSQEYMAALADIVCSEGARTEYDKAVLILTASPAERLEALAAVFPK